MLRIDHRLAIPDDELRFTASRSSGPGGQHVNKVETRVTLRFDVAASPSLTPEQKRRIRSRLASRMSKAGVLRVVAQKHRRQAANREAARQRLAELLCRALRQAAPRRPTRPPAATRRRRVESKRRRGEIKRRRRPVAPEG